MKRLGVRKAGECALTMHGYIIRDPFVTFSLENITNFLEAWGISPGHMTLAIQAA